MGLRLSMESGLRQEQEMDLKQTMTMRLELGHHIGEFEHQIIDKTEFIDIDINSEDSIYHVDMLGGLIVRNSEEEDSLLGGIVRNNNESIKDIEKIVVESFDFQEIDFDLGTKRNVDLVTLIHDGGQKFIMTVSIDKIVRENIKDSPSYKEAEVLRNADPSTAWSVQKYFGYHTIHYADYDETKGLVCKEFLPGQMVANLTNDIERAVEEYGEGTMKNTARAIGKMLANALDEFGGIPIDSNTLNIIVLETESGEITARYCDVEGIQQDDKGMRHELQLLMKEFGMFGAEILQSLKENSQRSQEIIERISI